MLFKEYLKEIDSLVIQPVILIVIVITSGHFDKTVMQPGKGIYIKGQDKVLLEWLLAAANRSENIELGLVIEMICN